MGRINQIRDVVLERREEDRTDRLKTEETVARFLAQTIQGAQGNKRGVKEASKFTLLPKKKRRITREAARQLGGTLEPEYTPEEIAAEAARQRGA